MTKEQAEKRILELHNEATQKALEHSNILGRLNEVQSWLNLITEAAKVVEEVIAH